MGDIKFGFNQKGKPTPSNIANLFDALAGILTIFMGSLNMAPERIVSVENKEVWNWVLMFTVPILLKLKSYFSVTIPPIVPSNQVAEIKSNG